MIKANYRGRYYYCLILRLCFNSRLSRRLPIMNPNPANSSTASLVVFCRRPEFNNGKQRIAATIGPAPTLELATHLLHTTLEDATSWPGPVIIAPAAPADQSWAAGLLTGKHRVCLQPDGNLGERINAVDRALRSADSQHLIYIGSDAPLLNSEYYQQARSALEAHDVVLGAADDGGVVLMGARCAWPELASLPWSSNDLGHQLELLCVQRGLTVKYLPARYDIDYANDLPRLHDDLLTDPRPARRALRNWLAAAGFGQRELKQ